MTSAKLARFLLLAPAGAALFFTQDLLAQGTSAQPPDPGPSAASAPSQGRGGRGGRGPRVLDKPDEVMRMEEYEPRKTLVVPQHLVPRATYPFIAVHSHHRTPADQAYLRKLLGEMDSINLRIVVNLSGSTGDKLKKGVDAFREASPDRLKVFANLDFSTIDQPDYGKRAAAQL